MFSDMVSTDYKDPFSFQPHGQRKVRIHGVLIGVKTPNVVFTIICSNERLSFGKKPVSYAVMRDYSLGRNQIAKKFSKKTMKWFYAK
jgi:hypothetical protein